MTLYVAHHLRSRAEPDKIAAVVDRVLCVHAMARLPLWLSYLLHKESLHLGSTGLPTRYVEDKLTTLAPNKYP